jgi:hypothetical protein
MEESIREYSGRNFSAEDISLIIETTKMYPKLSQSELACTVCEFLGWQTHSGKAKNRQCVGLLRQLEQEGHITLPVKKERKKPTVTKAEAALIENGNKATGQKTITVCGPIGLEIVRPGKRLRQWREYLNLYHVLGDAKTVGSQIRYMVISDGHDLGCLLFSSPSWALAPREKWIGWTAAEKKSRLHLIVNNSRFVLFPWVQIRNLASRALGMAARRLQEDWLGEYCYAPVLLETFVDVQYKGTSYKASNWIYLGETQGRGRNDRYKERALTRKAIYVYPLQQDCISVLKGEKPWKAVAPHV